MTIAIIGAGMAGLSCASALVAAGHLVRLFDKGRGPGGRMSTRRAATSQGDAGFDHGAQYFTVRDPAFRERVLQWQDRGLAAPWPAAGPDAWVGVPAMNAPVKDLAAGLDVTWSARVDRLERDGGAWRLAGEGFPDAMFQTVLLAVPAENTAPLLDAVAPDAAALARANPAAPCWTLMVAFSERVAFAADIMREDGPVGWAARNSAKPGRSGPESWVVQAGPAWSAEHLERTPEQVTALLLQAFAERVGGGLPETLAASAHRWRYARSASAGRGMLWDPAQRLGVCGDWLIGPRVECAWQSGASLAAAAGSSSR